MCAHIQVIDMRLPDRDTLNPNKPVEFPFSYQLDESILIFRGFGSNFSFFKFFSMKIMLANRIAPDGTPRFVASHLELICLPMSPKKDVRLTCAFHLQLINFEKYVCV